MFVGDNVFITEVTGDGGVVLECIILRGVANVLAPNECIMFACQNNPIRLHKSMQKTCKAFLPLQKRLSGNNKPFA